MRGLGIALLATAGIALATPASAQGVYFGTGPGGFGIGVGPGYYGGYSGGYAPAYEYGRRSGYHDYDGSYAYSTESRRCRMITIETRSGNLRRVQRC